MMLQDLHSHSNWSDGKDTIEDMVNAAIDIGLERFAVTDHVWKSSPWVWDYLKECRRVKEKYGYKIKVLCGFEAKCIDLDGSVDILDEVAKEADIVLGAIHRIPKGKGEYFKREEIIERPLNAFNCWFKSTLNMLRNPNVTTVAHVTAALSKYNLVNFLNVEKSKILLSKFVNYSREIELNIRHNDPIPILRKIIKKQEVKVHIGTDSHSVEELYRLWDKIFQEDANLL